MKKNIELTDKGTVLTVIIVLCLMYVMGFITSNQMKGETKFTKADIEVIDKTMRMYGDEIIVMKDKDGNLILNLGEID